MSTSTKDTVGFVALLSVKEVAQMLGVSHMTVRRLCDRGELPYYKIGNVMRLATEDVQDYLATVRRSTS